jgi:FMN-dependent NADH-azoreductase
MNLLLVTSSLFGEASQSRQIAREFVETWQRDNPGTRVVERDLTAETMPHLSQATLGAVMTPADKRTPEQAELARFADSLIEEVEAADTIVLAAPMYNFTISTTLKAWIDHIARAGRTFRYTVNGPEGLLKGRKIYVVTGRGGVYSGESPARAMDFQEPYLRGMLGFLGLTDVEFIHVEGLNISKDAAEAGRARARETIVALRPKQAA